MFGNILVSEDRTLHALSFGDRFIGFYGKVTWIASKEGIIPAKNTKKHRKTRKTAFCRKLIGNFLVSEDRVSDSLSFGASHLKSYGQATSITSKKT